MLPSSSSRHRPAQPSPPRPFRRPRLQFFLFLFSICTFLYLYTPLPFFFVLKAPDFLRSSLSRWTAAPLERVTLIVVWSGLDVPNYLGMFLRSVEANSARVDLLFVAKQDADGLCVDLGRTGRNIKSVCLSDEEYWDLHVDYLCERWDCKKDEREDLTELILSRGGEDYIHSHFRVLRGPIFERFFPDKATKWWGWCDTDVVLGNFDRQFPWDVAHKFDLIQPTHGTDAAEILVYLRGHMTFFQNRLSTLDKLHTFPAFQSLDAYMTGKPPVTAMEEEDFSTFFFHSNTQVTFLTYDTLLSGHFVSSSLSPHLVSLMYTKGAPNYSLPLVLPDPDAPVVPTFGDSPLATGVVRLDLGTTKEDVWFPRDGAVSYVPLKVKKGSQANARRFLMREVPGGVVRERVENWRRWELKGSTKGIREGLYQHFQITKKQAWFRNLPLDPLAEGRLLALAGFDDAAIWADRKLIWKGGKQAEAEKLVERASQSLEEQE